MSKPRETRGWSVSAKIGRYTGPREPNGCREWTSTLTPRGYPHLWVNGKTATVTRLILGLGLGDPRVAMHVCDNPKCVEPSHLRIGTPLDNMRDRDSKKRHRPVFGERHGHARLSSAQVAKIRAMRADGASLAEVATAFRVAKSYVSRVAAGLLRPRG